MNGPPDDLRACTARDTRRPRGLAIDLLRLGFLRRLARSPDADAFVLRGGLRIAQLAPMRRAIGDVDLVCTRPWDPAEAKRMLQRVLRTSMPDDVSFFRSRFDVYSGASPRPGVRVYAQGAVLGEGADLVVDVVFDLALHPRPAWVSMEGFRVRAVSSSTIVATKLRVVAELDRGWRPKDLSDALLLLRARPPADLGAAIEHAWAQTDVAPREILVRPSWWSPGRARWDAWRRDVPEAPPLDAAVGELRERLAPFWRHR